MPHQTQDVDIRNCAICRYATLRGRPAVFGSGCAERDTISVPPFVHLSKLNVSIGLPHGTACLVQQLVIHDDDACLLTTTAQDKVQSSFSSGFHACSCRAVCVLGERFGIASPPLAESGRASTPAVTSFTALEGGLTAAVIAMWRHILSCTRLAAANELDATNFCHGRQPETTPPVSHGERCDRNNLDHEAVSRSEASFSSLAQVMR